MLKDEENVSNRKKPKPDDEEIELVGDINEEKADMIDLGTISKSKND